MKRKSRSFYIGILLGLLFYFLDALIDTVLHYEELSYLQVLVTSVPLHEVYSRVLGFVFIVAMGIIVPELLNIPVYFRKKGSHEKQLSSDPALMVNVSNEIRTPLNAILGFVDLLKDKQISETSRRLYLNHIKTSGKYLLELINNLTDITLIETGTMFITREPCKLNQLMSRIQLKYEKQLAEKNKKDLDIKISTGVRGEDYTILTDEVRLFQILVNLMENALGFTDEGTIEFGYNQLDQNTLEFFVRDTGAGLSQERLNMLFSKYKKLGDNQMRPFDIVSLRMNIVKHLVELFGGELRADSQLGKGSDFRFALQITPVYLEGEKTGARDEPVKREEKRDTKWANKKVLIAEDVESNFVYLKEILKPTGMDILWAENGKEAVELCRSHSDVDVILMDILMPEMDGYEAARAIKKFRSDLPIIAQTAYNIEEMEYKDASNYFKKFMIKPIWSIDLLNTLSGYLDDA